MSLIVLYLDTRYDNFECNSLRDMTISSLFCDIWPSPSVKVTFIFIIRWTLCCCVLVPSTKFVGSRKFEIWTIVWRKLKWRYNNVITHSIFYEIYTQIYQGYIWATYRISIWSNIRELRYTVGNLTENYEDKMGIKSLWPWPLTQGHQFQ